MAICITIQINCSLFFTFSILLFSMDCKGEHMVKTNLNETRDYSLNEINRICNVKQQIFYMTNGIFPIDMYPSYDDKHDRKINRRKTKK